MHGFCNNTNASFFVDSGSSVSLVSPLFLSKINLFDQVQTDKTKLSSFTKNNISILGSIQLSISLGGLETDHKFFVSEFVQNDFLVGIDFLDKNRININMQKRQIETQFGQTSFKNMPKTLNKIHKITCHKTINIPPNTVKMVNSSLKMKNKSKNACFQGLVEPNYKFISNTGVFISSSWSYSTGKKLILQCVNVSEKPQYIEICY